MRENYLSKYPGELNPPADSAEDLARMMIDKGLIPKYNQAESETNQAQKETRALLESLDMQLLNQIFIEHFSRSGYDTSDFSLLPLEHVKIVFDENNLAGLSSNFDITLNAKAAVSEDGRVDSARVLWTFIHEQWHALTRNEIDSKDSAKMIPVTGYQYEEYVFSDKNEVEDILRLDVEFNEGVTELVTGLVFNEYIRRTGDKSIFGEIPDLSVSGVGKGSSANYLLYFANAKILVSLVSSIAEVPEEVAQDALIRGYIRNDRTFIQGLRNIFVEIMSHEDADTLDVNSSDFYMHLVLCIKKYLSDEQKRVIFSSVKKINQRIKEVLKEC